MPFKPFSPVRRHTHACTRTRARARTMRTLVVFLLVASSAVVASRSGGDDDTSSPASANEAESSFVLPPLLSFLGVDATATSAAAKRKQKQADDDDDDDDKEAVGFVELPFTTASFPFNVKDPTLTSVPTTVPGGALQWLGGFTVNFTGGEGDGLNGHVGGAGYGGWSSLVGSHDGRGTNVHRVHHVHHHRPL